MYNLINFNHGSEDLQHSHLIPMYVRSRAISCLNPSLITISNGYKIDVSQKQYRHFPLSQIDQDLITNHSKDHHGHQIHPVPTIVRHLFSGSHGYGEIGTRVSKR